MNIDEIVKQLDVEIQQNIDLSKITHTHTGGIYRYIVYPKTEVQLKETLKKFQENNIKYIVAGGLTNVVFSSKDSDTIIISMTKFGEGMFLTEEHGQPILNVDAKYETKEVSRFLMENAVTGFQWAEGIPGTIGGAIYMNASAYGPGIDGSLIDITVLTPDLETKVISNRELQFRYRKNSIQEKGYIILSGRFLLRYGKKWKIALRMLQYHRSRAKSQPLELPSAGSVFIPPMPYHVGAIIPKLKLKGKRIGGMEISNKNAGFIVNIDNGTGEDYLELVKYVEQKVIQEYGFDLEREVRFFGFSQEELK